MWKVIGVWLAVGGVAQAEVAVSPTPVAKPPAKKRVVREKENEGTEALNRFEADTVIKSKYERNGQPMEVDPD